MSALTAWHTETEPALDELGAAIEQISLEAGAFGDQVRETQSMDESSPGFDAAGERLARAVAGVRSCPAAPYPPCAAHLSEALAHFEQFADPTNFPDVPAWVKSFTTAMEELERFGQAFLRGTGQT